VKLTSNGVNYAYDFEDRLISTSTGVQIVYDGDGNRVSESVGGGTTKYLVDGQTPTHYAQPLRQFCRVLKKDSDSPELIIFLLRLRCFEVASALNWSDEL
jgi:hypothetical protein